MGKAAHSQPLLKLPVSAVLVLPERRLLHRCNSLEHHVGETHTHGTWKQIFKHSNSFPKTKTKLLSSGMRLYRGAASRLVKKTYRSSIRQRRNEPHWFPPLHVIKHDMSKYI